MTITELAAVLPRGSRVLCAVSGGADSMCLLHLLWSKRQELGIEVLAAHFEHGLRGEESLRDARFVKDWCAERGIEFILDSGDVGEYAKENGLGVEEAARTLRYAFLERTAEGWHCTRIATAHNADDNAETVLFNLTRGSGAAGLAGIPPTRENIVRPLLGVTRAEIERYLEENGVRHVEDSSNQSDDYARNVIRHRVLPVLRELNTGCAANIGRASRLLRQDEDFLRALAREFIVKYSDGESVPAAELFKLHKAVASRVVRLLCEKSVGENHVDAVLALLNGSERAFADVPGQRFRCERGRLYFREDGGADIESVRLAVGGSVDIAQAGLRLTADTVIFEEINGLFKNYYFKYENICGNIFCTGRKSGDSLRPAGRNCTKTLKSLFNEAGLTVPQRQRTVILRDDAGVLAVLGLAVDERTVPTRGDRAVRVKIENF